MVFVATPIGFVDVDKHCSAHTSRNADSCRVRARDQIDAEQKSHRKCISGSVEGLVVDVVVVASVIVVASIIVVVVVVAIVIVIVIIIISAS